MARDALLEGRNATDMRTVADGDELLAYLAARGGDRRRGHAGADADRDRRRRCPATPGRPTLIRALKAGPEHAADPVVALGADDDPQTVAAAYDAGANTYIVKPVTFLALVRLMKVFTAYWLETAELPPGRPHSPWPPATRSAARPRGLRRRALATRPCARCCGERRIDLVTTPERGARRASRTRSTTSSLVDREIEPPGTDGLTLAEELVRRRRRRR